MSKKAQHIKIVKEKYFNVHKCRLKQSIDEEEATTIANYEQTKLKELYIKLVYQVSNQLFHIFSEILDYNLQITQQALNLKNVTRDFIDEYLSDKFKKFNKITTIPTKTLRPTNYKETRKFSGNCSQISLMMMDNFHSFFTNWKEEFKEERNKIKDGKKSISIGVFAGLYLISDFFHKEGYTSKKYPEVLKHSTFECIKRYSSSCITKIFKTIFIPYSECYKTIEQSDELCIPFINSTRHIQNIVINCMVCFLFTLSLFLFTFIICFLSIFSNNIMIY